MKAAEDVFKDVRVSGCYFHFCQCLHRQIQANGLQSKYNSDPTFAANLRFVAALAFVPICDVVTQFEALKSFEFFRSALNGKSEIDVGVRKIFVKFGNYLDWKEVPAGLSTGSFSVAIVERNIN